MSYATYESHEVTKTTVVSLPPSVAPVLTRYLRARTRTREYIYATRDAVVHYLTNFAALGVSQLNAGLTSPQLSIGSTPSLSITQPTPTSKDLINTLQQLLALFEKGTIAWVDISPPTVNGVKLSNPAGSGGKVKAIIIQNDPSSSGNAQVGTQVLPPNSSIEIFTDEVNTDIDPTTIIVYPNGNILHISMLILRT